MAVDCFIIVLVYFFLKNGKNNTATFCDFSNFSQILQLRENLDLSQKETRQRLQVSGVFFNNLYSL